MEPVKIAKQFFDFQKTAFDNTFDAVAGMQDQFEKMANQFWGKNMPMPEEGKKVFNQWASAFKKNRTDLKITIDENYNKIGSFFG